MATRKGSALTEDEAVAWVRTHFGDAAVPRLEAIVAEIVRENQQQNLISANSIAAIWSRHVVDSAQLLAIPLPRWSHWLDVGTGAGFPGLVVGALANQAITLAEPRRRRAAFLAEVAQRLKLPADILVFAGRAQDIRATPFDVISARAVGPLADIFTMTQHVAGPSTTYLLPRGANVADELDDVRREWHGVFHVEQSLTNSSSGIVVAREIARR